MISSVLYIAVFLIFTNIEFLQVSADTDLETLTQIVRNHSNILNEFPSYVDRTKSLGKQIEDFEPKVSAYENYTKNIEESIVELKNISGIFTKKLKNFEPYTKRTDKLEGEIIQLLETAETFAGSVSSLEVYNRRTTILEEYINKTIDYLKISASERNSFYQNLESFHQARETQKVIVAKELVKVSTIQEKQQEIRNKFNDVINAVKNDENVTSENIIMDEDFLSEQSKLKSKVLEVDSVTQDEKDIAKMLKNIVAQFEEQKKNAADNLESLEYSYRNIQGDIMVYLPMIKPVTKSYEEMTEKLDNFIASLDEATRSQQTLQKNFEQLSDKIHNFITSHTSHYY